MQIVHNLPISCRLPFLTAWLLAWDHKYQHSPFIDQDQAGHKQVQLGACTHSRTPPLHEDTIGNKHFVPYSEVSLTQGLME